MCIYIYIYMKAKARPESCHVSTPSAQPLCSRDRGFLSGSRIVKDSSLGVE